MSIGKIRLNHVLGIQQFAQFEKFIPGSKSRAENAVQHRRRLLSCCCWNMMKKHQFQKIKSIEIKKVRKTPWGGSQSY